MFVKLKDGKSEEIIRKAIKKAGSYRKLAKITKIPRSTICGYIKGKAITEERFSLLTNFLNIKNKEDMIAERLPDNWKQVRGGICCVASKKKKGTFEKEMKKWQNFQAKKLKDWHRSMKKNNPEKYYNLQYSRFKKVGRGYQFMTNRGEKVRNRFEKQTADILFKLGINYEYEPLVHSGKQYFFQDFLIDNRIIVECTMWKGEKNAYKLKEKINALGSKYQIYVVIPKALYRYYKILDNHLILGLDEFVPIAQTFRK